MRKSEDLEILFSKIKRMGSKDLNLIGIFRLFNIFIKVKKEKNLEYLKIFIKEYYSIEEDMPEDFYELILNKMCNDDYMAFFNVLITRNIYSLISYLKYNKEDITVLEEIITALQYYVIPKRYINRLVEALKGLEYKNEDSCLSMSIKEEVAWRLQKTYSFNEEDCISIAYKIYLSIGLDNGLDLLSNKYGEIDYEKVHFLFSRLNTKDNLDENKKQVFNVFVFYSKRDYNNIIRQMLRGEFKELFLNFDYFYNNFNYFVSKLGIKMSKSKVKALLDGRYLAQDVANPEITGDILEDMLSSYYCKYDLLDIPEYEIHRLNFEIYNEFLRKKYKSSIPMIKIKDKEPFLCEIISLNDPRNLVLGYRAGNCFRINGDAAILFRNFLKSDHMRLLSISTLENKDFAMMLIMRNGNVLIGQGIEVSKRAPSNIKGKKLYDTCREVLKELMDYMNSMGDEIVATIIGSTNSNVSQYNNQILSFLVNPILENSGSYYNGIYNYQCLLDISEGKSLQDIKLYTPSVRYFDERNPILRRRGCTYGIDNNYLEIEKILTSLRFFRVQSEGNFEFYQKLLEHSELYTCCNNDWYITLFDDGTIDSFIANSDERTKEEYELELERIQQISLKGDAKNPFTLKYHRKDK